MRLKLFVIPFILMISACHVFGQTEKVNQYDQQGRKHGKWTKPYRNGQKAYVGQFNHGEPVGTFKRYHPNGNLKAIMNYREDDKVYTELYNLKGKKQAEGIYTGRKKDSTWLIYDENGNLVSKERYETGKREGKSVKFYSSGDTSQIMRWKDGKKHGIFKQFFENGQLKMIGRYLEGTLDGHLTIFYPNGYKNVEGKYKDNLREGKWVYYNEYGDTTNTIKYKKGIAENQDSLQRAESEELLKLEQNEGKFKDPKEQFYEEFRKK